MVIANFFRGGYSARYTQVYLGYIYTQNSDFHSEFTSYKSKFEFVSRKLWSLHLTIFSSPQDTK